MPDGAFKAFANSRDPDRYGRARVFLFDERGLVQERLLRRGEALARPLRESVACSVRLLEAEVHSTLLGLILLAPDMSGRLASAKAIVMAMEGRTVKNWEIPIVLGLEELHLLDLLNLILALLMKKPPMHCWTLVKTISHPRMSRK